MSYVTTPQSRQLIGSCSTYGFNENSSWRLFSSFPGNSLISWNNTLGSQKYSLIISALQLHYLAAKKVGYIGVLFTLLARAMLLWSDYQILCMFKVLSAGLTSPPPQKGGAISSDKSHSHRILCLPLMCISHSAMWSMRLTPNCCVLHSGMLSFF